MAITQAEVLPAQYLEHHGDPRDTGPRRPPRRVEALEPEHDEPFYDRDYNLCILCGRCVRMCAEVRGAGVLAFIDWFRAYNGDRAADNRAGFYFDGTPYTPQSPSRIEGNIVAFNDIGAILLPAVKGNLFAGNTFYENVEQVGVQGGGLLAANQWDGNFWSDYTGVDVNGDGRGEAPYRAERFFDGLMDHEPLLRALLYSPAVQTLEFAATTFPIVRPEPKFVDARPRFAPADIPAADFARTASPMAMAVTGAMLMAFGLIAGVLALPRWRVRWPSWTPSSRSACWRT